MKIEEIFTQFNATIGYLDDNAYPDILTAGNYTDGEPNNRSVRMNF